MLLAVEKKMKVLALWSFGLLSVGEATLLMVITECPSTRFKISKLKRWEVVTPETVFCAQCIEPALPEHEIKQKMELFCQRR